MCVVFVLVCYVSCGVLVCVRCVALHVVVIGWCVLGLVWSCWCVVVCSVCGLVLLCVVRVLVYCCGALYVLCCCVVCVGECWCLMCACCIMLCCVMLYYVMLCGVSSVMRLVVYVCLV